MSQGNNLVYSWLCTGFFSLPIIPWSCIVYALHFSSNNVFQSGVYLLSLIIRYCSGEIPHSSTLQPEIRENGYSSLGYYISCTYSWNIWLFVDPILHVDNFFSFFVVLFSQVDISITLGTHASEDAGNTHFCSLLFSLFMLSSLVHAVLLQVSCLENETLLVII